MIIPKFRLRFDQDQIEQYHSLVQDILENSKQLSNGEYTSEFEDRFAKEINCKHAIAVRSGIDALELSCRMIKDTPQRKVFMIPTNTDISNVVALERLGISYNLSDMDYDTLGLSLSDVKTFIDTFDTLASGIIFVHLGGIVSDTTDDLIHMAKESNILIVEDSSQSLLSEYKGIKTGNLGDVSYFSFSYDNIITTGEGGMITTNDDSFNEKIRILVDSGKDPKNTRSHLYLSGDYKITEFQSALGLVELDRLHKRINRRREIANRYRSELSNDSFKVITPKYPSSHYRTIVLLKKKSIQSLYKFLEKYNISLPDGLYSVPLHTQPCFRGKYTKKAFPSANLFSETHVCLPNYPDMSDDEVDYIIEVLNEW